jgi:phospholipid/cholesterol/gamma-HCH transport system substrate-binding protein
MPPAGAERGDMSKPFKFRYTNELVGGFVLVILTLLVAAVIVAGHAQEWFEPVYTLRTRLPEQGTFGLRKGAEVSVLQTLVGAVSRIEVDDEGHMDAVMKIRGDFTRFVRTDSVALVKKKFVVGGDAYVEISRGVGEPLPREGAFIECKVDVDLLDQIQIFLDELRDASLRGLKSLDDLLQEHTGLAADLRDPEGTLQKFLASLESLTAGLERGEGTAGKLLKDPAIAEEVEKLLATLNKALTEVDAMLVSLNQATAELPGLTDALATKLDELPGVLLRAQITLQETERLLKGLQRHWLLRKYIEQPAPSTRLPPADVGGSGGGR